jgi:hypothetical protein
LRKARPTRRIQEEPSGESEDGVDDDDDDDEEQIYQDNGDDDEDFDAPEEGNQMDKKKFKRMKKLKTDDESRYRSERGDGYTSTEY